MVLIDQGLQCYRDRPISFRQGDSVEISWSVLDTDGNTVDVSSYNSRFVAVDQDGTIVLDGTQATILTMGDGTVTLAMDEADTYDVAGDVYTYELRIVGLTNTWTLSTGTMRVHETAIPEA